MMTKETKDAQLAYELSCKRAELDGYDPYAPTKDANGMDVEIWELYMPMARTLIEQAGDDEFNVGIHTKDF